GISFFYSLNAIGAQRKVSCNLRNVPLRNALDQLLPPLRIQYKLMDEQVILYALPHKSSTPEETARAEGTDTMAAKAESPTVVRTISVIRGKVMTLQRQPLEGASVLVAGTKMGTVTDADGLFILEAELPAGELQVSYTSYQAATSPFKGSGWLPDILLQPVTADMGEVVVIGYGTQTRRSITTATSTVRGKDITDAPVTTIDAALQGRATGVLVSQQGGTPGAPVRIQVRGTSSISSGTEPLYIVDGVYIFQDLTGIGEGNTSNAVNPLATLNPDDVASIEILKDAAATAIYGARGANGVIIITTKQGRKGQGNISLTLNQGRTTPTNLLENASGSEWLATVDQARTNTVGFGISPGQELFNPLTLVSNSLPTPAGITGPQFGPNTSFTRELAEQTNTNWRDMLLQQGHITDLKLSASNGFQQGNFYLSGQYWDETGILTNQRLQRFSFRANLDFSPSPKWRFGSRFAPGAVTNRFAQVGTGHNGTLLGRSNTGATGGWAQVYREALPIMPVYNTDGSYFDPMRGRNVAAGADPDNFNSQQQQQRFVGNAFVEFKPAKAFTLRGEGGADFLNALSRYWVSDVIRYNRYASETGAFISNLSATAYATYTSNWKGPHDLSATGGAEWQKTTYRRNFYTFEGVQGSQQEIGEISNGSQTLAAVSGIFPDQMFSSLFVRGQYSYDRRILASFSLRRDGSSVFSPGNRYGYFPSLSAGWVLSDEHWFRGSSLANTISLLKLRSSYGQTGNAAIPAFAYLSNFVNWPVYGQSPALSLSVLGNPDIRWEKNNQLDAALEAGFWNNRLHTSIEGFVRVSEDMLLNVPVAPTVGIGAGNQSVIVNIGNLRNAGIEWELNGVILESHKRKDRLRWSASLNFSWIKDRVLKLTDNFTSLPVGDFPVANGIQQGVGITQIGGRLGAFYLAEYAGLDSEGFETIYEVDKEVLRSTGRTVRSGQVIRATSANILNNRMVHYNKTGLPTWYGGLSQTLQWMGLELRAHLTFQGGNYIYDGREENASYVRTGNNVLVPGLLENSWRPDRPNASLPRLTWNMRDNSFDANGVPSPQTMGSRT
ncbi:MAG: SusC/RagA family TonB-linked outer membrane protein, partial [Chitinophagaceae bacterium]|nr:SusC/RagA family TonB-linked outer membrane protein [Chitinophagaceae bacterium]